MHEPRVRRIFLYCVLLDSGRQRYLFSNRRNREVPSTRKLKHRVFAQPRWKPDTRVEDAPALLKRQQETFPSARTDKQGKLFESCEAGYAVAHSWQGTRMVTPQEPDQHGRRLRPCARRRVPQLGAYPRMTMPRSRALKSWVAGFRRYRIILAAQATKR